MALEFRIHSGIDQYHYYWLDLDLILDSNLDSDLDLDLDLGQDVEFDLDLELQFHSLSVVSLAWGGVRFCSEFWWNSLA